MNNFSIGIDLGTTNSVVAVMMGDNPEVIPNAEGKRLTPSVVCIREGRVVVGSLAKQNAIIYPENTVLSPKRKVGSGERITLDGTKYTVESIQGLILKKLVDDAAQALNIDRKGKKLPVVITVPARFDSEQRESVKTAAEMADLEVLRLIAEPTAACLDYKVGSSAHSTNSSGVVFVYDFGGGTLDTSVVAYDISKGSGNIADDAYFQVKATGGDMALGGDDIDRLIAENLRKKIKDKFKEDPYNNVQAKQRILSTSEEMKIALSQVLEHEISLPFIVGNNSFSFRLTRVELEQEVKKAGILDRMRKCITETLEAAKMSADQIDEVLMVGGSTRAPFVIAEVEKVFGKSKIRNDNPDEVVARGAARQAAVLSRSGKTNVLLVDVTPLDIGIETQGGLMAPILKANTPLPCEKTEVFTTTANDQTEVSISVYQGPSKVVSNNKMIETFTLQGIERGRAGTPRIEVTLSLDTNGILSIKAHDKKTGAEKSIVVDQKSTRMSKEEIEEMKLKFDKFKDEEEKVHKKVILLNQIDQLALQVENELDDNQSKLDSAYIAEIKGKLSEYQQLRETEKDYDKLMERFNDLNKLYASVKEKVASVSSSSSPNNDGDNKTT